MYVDIGKEGNNEEAIGYFADDSTMLLHVYSVFRRTTSR